MNAKAGLLLVCLFLAPLTACSGGNGNPGGSSTLIVTGVSPSTGDVYGGELLTITGEGFAAGMTVSIGGSPCTNVVVVSETEATCMTPAVGPNQVGPNGVVLELMTKRALAVPGFAYQDPVFRVLAPAQGSMLPIGAVAIDFEVENFVLGDYGQGHLHFYIDGRAVGPYEFLNGATNEVHLNGAHTHTVHWTSSSSIEIYGLTEGAHTVEFILAASNHTEFPHSSAGATLDFRLDPPMPGVFGSTQLLTGLPSIPIEMQFTGDGRLLFTEQETGNIRVVDTATWQLSPTPFYTLPVRNNLNEDGIIGLALHPDFASNGYVYASHVTPGGLLRVARMEDVGGVGTNETEIANGIPMLGFHFSGKLRFAPDGMLLVSVGDSSQGPAAQDVNAFTGKLLRITDNGGIPANNPIPGSPVYARGFRNPFGFDLHPDTDDIWLVDNGPDNDDELNLVVAGGNYGWDGADSSMGFQGSPCCVDPLWSSGNSQMAPTGLTFSTQNTAYGTAFEWNAFFANNNNGEVIRVVPAGPELDQLGSMTTAFTGGLGSIVGITEAPDGFLYVSTRNRQIYRLTLNP